jgi:serine/threonine-protein kinase
MTQCPACQSSIPEDARFCPRCGTASDAGASRTAMFEDQGRPETPRPSAPSHHGRFEPGHRLGERYRIVGLLGQGGMGDVYRADDQELGQSVALKFLPDRLATDAVELDLFRREVRVARGVAHPNVCRTYDIASIDDHVFLVMEYVDGEDLASVIRRMGRPSQDKAVEIARQLCLGLGAAHEAGVLHRDLKPANIMIDGRGKVRITDFGLAGLAKELADDRTIAGTPAYMAPEQLRDGRVSTASEIYSLGLILHEVFTGQRVFDTHNVQELKRLHSESRITSPSTIVEGLDPVVERVLMRCLDPDPSRRPQSAYGVLAALPGGDPLAAALAAGETPSPELVADAGEHGVISPRVGVPAMLATVALFVVIALMAGQSLRPIERSPAELAVLADQAFEDLVGGERPRFQGGGLFRPVPDSLDLRPEYLDRIYYWKRWSKQPLVSRSFHSEFLTQGQLLQLDPGDAGLVLDRFGHVRGFRRVLPDSVAIESMPDPATVFETMGLKSGDYVESGDSAGGRTWRRTSGEGPEIVRMGFENGMLVELTSGTPPIDTAETFLRDAAPPTVPLLFVVLLVLVPTALAAFLAWRNLRAGRGDRRGANLFAAVVFVGYTIESAFALSLDQMPAGLLLNRLIGDGPLGHALYHSVLVWIQYIAIEPYLRRVRPASLVSWARMVSRRWRDPILGRDVLAGLFLGGSMVALQYAAGRILLSTNGQLSFRDVLSTEQLLALESTAHALAWWAYAFAFAAPAVMMAMVIYLLLALVLRRDGLAIAAIPILVIVPAALSATDTPAWYAAVFVLVIAGSLLVAVMRFGVLAGVMVMFTLLLANSLPWALDPAAWYGPVALMTPILLSALAVWAGITALGDKASMRSLLGEDRID